MTLQEFIESFQSLGPRARVKSLPQHLGELAPGDRTSALLSILRDERSTPMVKAAALKFLRETCVEDPEIFQSYLADRNPAVAKASARALREIERLRKKTSPIAKAFIKKLKTTEDKDKRLKILRAVARLKSPWAPTVLVDSLDDPSEYVRDYLVRELGRREILSQGLLLRRMACGPWYAKSAVIKILGVRKSASCLTQLAHAVQDPNVDVRRSAAEALGEIGGKDGLCLLLKLAEDRNPYVKKAAEDSLRKTSDLKFS